MRGEVAHEDLPPPRHIRPHRGREGLYGQVSGLQHVQERGSLLSGLRTGRGGLEEGQLQERHGVTGIGDPGEDPREGRVG